MADALNRPKSRQWADFVVILTGVALLALAIWPGGRTGSAEATQEVGRPDVIYMLYVAAGALAVAAVLVGQRWRRRAIARGMLVVAALALLGGLLVVRDLGPRVWLTLILPAAVLLAATPALGPMPPPEAG